MDNEQKNSTRCDEMSKLKISFLIPVKNEEKIIERCLNNLLEYKRPEDEIIVGLDNCTDSTEFLVRKAEYFIDNLSHIISEKKLGKHGILKRMIEKAKGDIIIVHDADWLLTGKKSIVTLLKYFEDPRVGGIENSFSMTYYELEKGKGVGYIGDAMCDKFLTEFKNKYFTTRENGILYVDRSKMSFPFFVNFIRKNLIQEATTVADDLERVFNILDNNYKIVVLEDEKIPHHVVIYKHIPLEKLYFQKVRGHLARKQIRHTYKYSTNIKGFYVPMSIFMIRKMLKLHSIKYIMAMFVWMAIGVISYFHALALYSLKSLTTEKLWEMRVR